MEPPSPEKQGIPEPPAAPPLSSSLWGISMSTWTAGVAGLGLLETGYLSYLKLIGSEAFCPVSGGGCGDVLYRDYSIVFGIPLPLVGMVTYGLVTALSLQENGEELLPGLDDLDIRLTLLLLATSLATASPYFLFILNTKFVGMSCLYCLSSAFISFMLFFIRLKDIGLARIQKFVGIQLVVAVIVALALTNSYSSATTQLEGSSSTYSSRGSQGRRRNHHQQMNSHEQILEAGGVRGRPAVPPAAEAYKIELRRLRGGRNHSARRPSQTSATTKTTRRSWLCWRLVVAAATRCGAGAGRRGR